MTLARSTGSRGSCASPAAGHRRMAATAASAEPIVDVRQEIFTRHLPSDILSTVLRTERDHLVAGERDDPEQAGLRPVARPAGLESHRFADGSLEFTLVDVVNPK